MSLLVRLVQPPKRIHVASVEGSPYAKCAWLSFPLDIPLKGLTFTSPLAWANDTAENLPSSSFNVFL
ncbi:unnamed protein product [Malus baccata var. baccata]